VKRIIILTDLEKYYRIKHWPHGAIAKIAKYHDVSSGVVNGLRDRLCEANGNDEEAGKNRHCNPRPKRGLSTEEINKRISAVPLEERTTLKELSLAVGIPRTTLSKYVKATRVSSSFRKGTKRAESD
jgi:hypothetical protein